MSGASDMHKGDTPASGVAQTLNAPPSKLLLVAAFAAVYIIWGSTYLAIKYAIETLPPFLMAGCRFVFAGATLYLWARFVRKDAKPQLLHWRTGLIVGALLLLGGNGMVVWAERSITSSLAALLVAVEPLWIVLLNWARPGGERPNLKVALGLIVGFFGVWLLVGGKVGATTAAAATTASGASAHGGAAELFGAILVVVGAFSWAFGSLYSLRAPAPESPLLGAGMQMLAGGALLLILGTLTGEWTSFNVANFSARSVVAFIYLFVFGSVVSFTAYSWLLHNVSPARASTYAYVNPVVAVILGWAIAGEAVSARTLTGAAVIIASVWLITSHRKKSDSPQRA